jgi:hypothetical protein
MAGPRPHIPFPPDLILYVNLVAKGAPKFFIKTLAPRLTVLDIPYFAGAYSRTCAPYRLTQLLRLIPRTQSVMLQLYNTALGPSTIFSFTQVYPLAGLSQRKACCLGPWGATSSELVLQCYLITWLASLSLYAC